MLKILNLESTINGFANQFSRKYHEIGFQSRQLVSIGMKNADQIIEIEFSPDGVNAKKASQTNDTLMLSDQEIVRFVFGSAEPSAVVKLPSKLRFLDALFPVDFCLWSNETV